MIKLYALDSYVALNQIRTIDDNQFRPVRLKSAKPKVRSSNMKVRPSRAKYD